VLTIPFGYYSCCITQLEALQAHHCSGSFLATVEDAEEEDASDDELTASDIPFVHCPRSGPGQVQANFADCGPEHQENINFAYQCLGMLGVGLMIVLSTFE
jgi:hypothetical protein